MKKFLVFILSLVYLTGSTGATVHMHYCMGKLVGWSLQHDSKKKDKCRKCGMKNFANKKGCCKDEQKHIQIEKDQKGSAFQCNFNDQFDALASWSTTKSASAYIISPVLEYTTTHAPPFKEKAPVFIRNCVFRI
ncbi:MAG TPA: hypothetical protein VKC90_05750 [Chitinophagaceae bacterium]|nr:hypothetical protein [Chitinophagaceae bacterium]